MSRIKNESIFQGIVEFTGPNTGTRFRFVREGVGWVRFAKRPGSDAFVRDGFVILRGKGRPSPERLLDAEDA